MRKTSQILLWAACFAASGTLTAQSLAAERLIGIDSLFRLAESGSRRLRAAALNAEAATKGVEAARIAKLPSAEASVSASYLGDAWIAKRNFSGGMNADIPHLGNNFALEASQVIYAGGALSAAVKSAKLQSESAELHEQQERCDVRFALVGNYLELYRLCNASTVYTENIAQTRKLLENMRAKYREGLALRNDITRYELRLQSLELALEQTHNSQQILNNDLVTTLSLPRDTRIGVDTTLLGHFPQTAAESEWQQTAQHSSTVLRAAEVGVQLSKTNEKSVRAARLPTIALIAGDRLDGPITIEVPPINKNLNYWYVGVGVRFNIGAAYKTGKRLQQARLTTARAEEEARYAQERLQTAVEAAHVRFMESFTIYATRMKNLELAEQNYKVVSNRYLNGLALITDLLDASNERLDAQLQAANAQLQIWFCYYALKREAGTL